MEATEVVPQVGEDKALLRENLAKLLEIYTPVVEAVIKVALRALVAKAVAGDMVQLEPMDLVAVEDPEIPAQ